MTQQQPETLPNLNYEQSVEYTINVLNALIQAIEQIAQIQGLLPKKKAIEQFLTEFDKKSPEIMTAILYSIKPEYRETYLKLFETLATLRKI